MREDHITQNFEVWTSAISTEATTRRGGLGSQAFYGLTKLRELILELAIRGRLRTMPLTHSSRLKTGVSQRHQYHSGVAAEKREPQRTVGENPPFELPESWCWAALRDIGQIFNGNSISESEKQEKYITIGDGLPYIATKDVGYGWDPIDYENGVLIPADEALFKVAPKGAVLICSEGGSAGKKCGITDRDICFGNKLYAFVPSALIDSRYLLVVYLSSTFYSQFAGKMTGIIGGYFAR